LNFGGCRDFGDRSGRYAGPGVTPGTTLVAWQTATRQSHSTRPLSPPHDHPNYSSAQRLIFNTALCLHPLYLNRTWIPRMFISIFDHGGCRRIHVQPSPPTAPFARATTCHFPYSYRCLSSNWNADLFAPHVLARSYTYPSLLAGLNGSFACWLERPGGNTRVRA
jgi:hypothetical protein